MAGDGGATEGPAGEVIDRALCLVCKRAMGTETRTYLVLTVGGVPWPVHLLCGLRGPLSGWLSDTLAELRSRP